MLVFDDPTAISVQDRDTEGEQRWITVRLGSGFDPSGRTHTII